MGHFTLFEQTTNSVIFVMRSYFYNSYSTTSSANNNNNKVLQALKESPPTQRASLHERTLNDNNCPYRWIHSAAEQHLHGKLDL